MTNVVVEHCRDLLTQDNVRLVMDVYRPAASGRALPGPFPVVLERTPYSREQDRIVDFARRAAAKGFVFVAQDVRGRGESEGAFGMLFGEPDEGSDGADTMAWLLRQSWCNGRIATVGGSFSAANQQALALNRPPGLCVQVLRDAGTNYYRRMLRYHGVANIGVILPWILDQAITSREVQSEPTIQEDLRHMRGTLGRWIGRLPLRRGASPLAQVPLYEDLYFSLVDTADDAELWHNPVARLEGHWDEYPTDVAVLLISGWFAHHCAANFDKFNEFRKRLSRPVALIIGPWLHGPDMLEATIAGDCDFGPAAALAPVHKVWLDWLERFLPFDTPASNVGPPVQYFLMGTGDGHRTPAGRVFHGGTWKSSHCWPPAEARLTSFYLHKGGLLSHGQPTHHSASSTYVFDPTDPCPGIGSSNLQVIDALDFVLPGPRDQRCRPQLAACRGSSMRLSERRDVIVFQTELLGADVEVTGDIFVKLWVQSSAPDTDFVARLIDVYPVSADHPDGLALGICDGILRLRYRDRQPRGTLVEPGSVHEIEIELNPTGNLFKTGHRIRLDITSSSWPQYEVNPNTGELPGEAMSTVVARQTIYHDAFRPSRVLLPLIE